MAQEASAAKKQSTKQVSGKQAGSQHPIAKLTEKKTMTVFEPASKVAVLGYN